MLYYITEDIIEAAENRNSKVIEILEYIAMAHRHENTSLFLIEKFYNGLLREKITRIEKHLKFINQY